MAALARSSVSPATASSHRHATKLEKSATERSGTLREQSCHAHALADVTASLIHGAMKATTSGCRLVAPSRQKIAMPSSAALFRRRNTQPRKSTAPPPLISAFH